MSATLVEAFGRHRRIRAERVARALFVSDRALEFSQEASVVVSQESGSETTLECRALPIGSTATSNVSIRSNKAALR